MTTPVFSPNVGTNVDPGCAVWEALASFINGGYNNNSLAISFLDGLAQLSQYSIHTAC